MEDRYKISMQKRPDVTDLAGEKVMIDFETGKYYMLTGSANDIWDMLGSDKDSEGIVGALTEIYEVDTDVCRDGVHKYLRELEKLGVVSLEKCD